MIDEPLGAHWRYDLGDQKISELRSALGLTPEGPAPRGAVFAYAVVPALARMLTHPEVAAHRDSVRMSRLEVVFASELDMRNTLTCGIEVHVRDAIAGVVSCTDLLGARAVSTLHLDLEDTAPPAAEASDRQVTLSLDPARSVAFAAATWDLNPAYWDAPFAEAAGLGSVVCPPGLAVALSIEAIEAATSSALAAIDVRFEHAARPGDELTLSFSRDGDEIPFRVVADDRLVLYGRGALGMALNAL